MQITSMLMKDSFFSSFLVLLINFPFNSVPMFVTIMLHGLGLDERQRFGHFCLLYPLSLSRASLYALYCIFFTKDLWNQVSWIGTCVHHWQIGTIIRIRGCRHFINWMNKYCVFVSFWCLPQIHGSNGHRFFEPIRGSAKRFSQKFPRLGTSPWCPGQTPMKWSK